MAGEKSSYNRQRVRIGLTGLAVVFLLVMIGAAITRWSDEEPLTNDPETVNAMKPEPTEPLAEIGAAPGESSASTNAMANAANVANAANAAKAANAANAAEAVPPPAAKGQ